MTLTLCQGRCFNPKWTSISTMYGKNAVFLLNVRNFQRQELLEGGLRPICYEQIKGASMWTNRKSSIDVDATANVAWHFLMVFISIAISNKHSDWCIYIDPLIIKCMWRTWCYHVDTNVGERKLIIKLYMYLQVKNYKQSYLRTNGTQCFVYVL